jgi:hypothetical protein
MSAVIIPLPGAAAAPVLTPKLPPGRPPKNVTSIRSGSWYRSVRQVRMYNAGVLEADARRYRDAAASMPEYMNFSLEKAALLEAEARALRGAPR